MPCLKKSIPGFALALLILLPALPVPCKEKMPDAKAILTGKYEKMFEARALLTDFDGAKLHPDGKGAVQMTKNKFPVQQVVVVEKTDMVRVVIDHGYLATLLYVPPGSLKDVTTRRVTATSQPGKKAAGAADAFIELAPGRQIKRLDHKAGYARIEISYPWLRMTAWVPEDAAGKVFVPDKKKNIKDKPAGDTVFLKDNTSVLDSPGGTELAKFYNADDPDADNPYIEKYPYPVYPVGPAAKGYRLIEYSKDSYTIRGFVPCSALSEKRKGSLHIKVVKAGRSSGFGEFNANMITVTTGTLLYDKAGGSPVAALKEEHTFFGSKYISPDGWMALKHRAYGTTLLYWLQVSQMAFEKDTFGKMIKAGRFYMIMGFKNKTECRKWDVKPEADNPFAGDMQVTYQVGTTITTHGYGYEYSLNTLTLLGPYNFVQSEEGGASSACGCMEYASIETAGKDSLEFDGYTVYFTKKACEEARKKGKGPSMSFDDVPEELESDQ